MAGMQRFVTYLYFYKGNEKLHNAGFAKIEIRGGQCRMEMHLKGIMSQENLPKVYLFSRENGMIHAVETGELSIKAGGGDCNLIFSSETIADSPYSIYDMKGIWIPVNDDYMYASQWDDGQIKREQIKIWRADKYVGDGVDSKNDVQESVQEHVSEPVKDMWNHITECMAASETTVSENNINATKTDREAINPMEQRTSAEQRISTEQRTSAEPHSSVEQYTSEMQHTSVEQQVSTEKQIPVLQATQLHMNENILEDTRREYTLLESFLRLQKREQIIEVFETGKRQISGIHIQLSDLRELPRKFWTLGNNSFLLHGFFNYQYLLLGKRTEGENEYIFVGVPGTFHGQEQIMASLFGFAEFLPGKFYSRKQGTDRKLQEIDSSRQLCGTLRTAEVEKVAPEAFGYWCHFMME